MKLYLECNMGAAGDMLMAALYELLPDGEAFLARMRALGLPGVDICPEPAQTCGIFGTHMRVTVSGAEEESVDVPAHEHSRGHERDHTHTHERRRAEAEHAHGLSYPELMALIGALPLPEQALENAAAVYRSLAEAEAQVHGTTVEQVHFHEVGAMDAVADIVGVCLLIDMLSVTEVAASPVHVGSGFVQCAHGILPVPAPASALLLRGIPIYGGEVRGELCTPTGAALLRRFAKKFGNMEPMAAVKIGYGIGKKKFERANCVRAFLYADEPARDEIAELSCNLDDMTPEAVAFAAEELLAAGALDVFTTPIVMKKGRAAVLLTVLCRTADEARLTELLFFHTTTLGVRTQRLTRAVLERRTETRETPRGPVRVKTAEGYGVKREKPEYEDLARIAREAGTPLTPDCK